MGFRKTVRAIINLNEPPERLAFAFAVGVFVAFTPTIGLHTITAFFLSWVLRMNKAVTFAGTLVSNPYTVIPIYGISLWFGSKLLGQRMGFDLNWKGISLWTLWTQFKHLLLPFVLGTTILGIGAAIISYFSLYYLIKRYRGFRQS